MRSLTGAVLGVVVISALSEILRQGENGIAIHNTALALPKGTQEIALGVIMALILILRPSGLTRGREVKLRFRLPRFRGVTTGQPAAMAQPPAKHSS
jgi:branched-chain amino acid transport system permease protein